MTVTATELRRLVDVPVDKTDADLQSFLDAAALIRSEDLAGSGLSSSRLDLIERYLAAHFAVVSYEHGGMISSKYGNATDFYRSTDNKLQGLSSTVHGQTALSLDTSNTLQSTMSSRKAQFSVIKTITPCEDD